jgi:hypothetical protein
VRAGALRDRVPERLRKAISEPLGARAVVFALCLDADEQVRRKQLEAARRAMVPAERDEFDRVLDAARGSTTTCACRCWTSPPRRCGGCRRSSTGRSARRSRR